MEDGAAGDRFGDVNLDHVREALGMPARPVRPVDRLSEAVIFGEDDEFQQVLDEVIPPKPRAYEMNIKELIAQQDAQREYEDVTDIPNWPGVTVRLQALTAAERDAFESSVQRMGPKGQQVTNTRNLRARLVALCLVDPDKNERVFTKPEDIQMLGSKSAKALDYLFSKAAAMNGLTKEDVKAMEGNFDETDGEETPIF